MNKDKIIFARLDAKLYEQLKRYADVEKAEKVFYHFNEWSGWRFYLKAIRHKDWRSIKKHIKSKFI